MPIRYRIDHERGLIVTTADGQTSGEDLQAHGERLAADPDAQGLNELVDLSSGPTPTAPTDAIRDTATYLREKGKNREGSKLAFVAPTDALYGLARLYQAHRDYDNISIGVFRALPEAEQWLLDSEPDAG